MSALWCKAHERGFGRFGFCRMARSLLRNWLPRLTGQGIVLVRVHESKAQVGPSGLETRMGEVDILLIPTVGEYNG